MEVEKVVSDLSSDETSIMSTEQVDSETSVVTSAEGHSPEPALSPTPTLRERFPIDPESDIPKHAIITLIGEKGHGKTMIGSQIFIKAHPQIKKNYGLSPQQGLSGQTMWDPKEELDHRSKDLGKCRLFECGLKTYLIDTPSNEIHDSLNGMWLGNLIIVVISAEEETSPFTEKCQTRFLLEWGLQKLGPGVDYIILITKMDLIGWKQARFEELKSQLFKMVPKLEEVATVIPVSGSKTDNIIRKAPKCDWFKGDTLLQYLVGWSGSRSYMSEIWTPNIESPFEFVLTNWAPKIFFGKVSGGRLDLTKRFMTLPYEHFVSIENVTRKGWRTTTACVDELLELEVRQSLLFWSTPALILHTGRSGHILKRCLSPKSKFICESETSMVATKKLVAKVNVVEGSILENSIFSMHMQIFQYKAFIKNLKKDGKQVHSLREDEEGEIELNFEHDVCVRGPPDNPKNDSRINSFLLESDGRIKAIGQALKFEFLAS